nr:myb-like protein P [Tanacetum cinerariifolium]
RHRSKVAFTARVKENQLLRAEYAAVSMENEWLMAETAALKCERSMLLLEESRLSRKQGRDNARDTTSSTVLLASHNGAHNKGSTTKDLCKNFQRGSCRFGKNWFCFSSSTHHYDVECKEESDGQ